MGCRKHLKNGQSRRMNTRKASSNKVAERPESIVFECRSPPNGRRFLRDLRLPRELRGAPAAGSGRASVLRVPGRADGAEQRGADEDLQSLPRPERALRRYRDVAG